MNKTIIDTAGIVKATFFARMILGLLFLMAGWHKVFVMGADTHAIQLFVEGYRDSWIPTWLLYGTGFIIPFIELIGGLILMVGIRIKTVLITLGFLLVLVTYGHLLNEPFYDITTHIFPRLALLLFILLIPTRVDRWSLDYLLRKENDTAD